jgi:hypothetical protein
MVAVAQAADPNQALIDLQQQLDAMQMQRMYGPPVGEEKKKKKKKRKKDASSSSGSSSDSDDSDGEKKYRKIVVWKDTKGKGKKVKPESLQAMEALKFKKRGDLLSFAAVKRGALAAQFLTSVRCKLQRGSITRESDLRDVEVAAWCSQYSGVTDANAKREVETLSNVMDLINKKDLPRAMDTIAQRIKSIQLVATKRTTAEKSQAMELKP